jgi:hypothetical protein
MAVKSRWWGLEPWCGLAAAAAGVALFQQVVSNALHFDCNATTGVAGIAWGVLSLSIVLGGAFVSWRALPEDDAEAPATALRRFIVHLSLMAAMLAGLGIVFELLATALLPGCRP